MTVKGLDYAWSKPSPSAIWNGGYRFVCRYLSWLPNGKVITKSELNSLRTKGIMVALNWEYAAGDMKNGGGAGKSHATEAVKQAKALGYPKGCSIYFSCDFDASPSQLSGPVTSYCREAAKIVRAAGYRFGIYGGYKTIKYAFDHKLVDDGWQTYAWSSGRWDSRAHLRQVKNGVRVGGADCDIDEIHGTVYMMGGTPAAAQEEDILATLDDLRKVIREETAKATWTQDNVVAVPYPIREDSNPFWPPGTIMSHGLGHAIEANQRIVELMTKVDGLATLLDQALKAGGGNFDAAPVLAKLDELAAKLAATEAERDALNARLAEALKGETE